jgi:hypothetical protein
LSRRGSFYVGTFAETAKLASEVAALLDELAERNVRVRADEIDRLLRSLRRTHVELSNAKNLLAPHTRAIEDGRPPVGCL